MENEDETVNRATEPEDKEIVHVASQDIAIPLSELKKMLTEERAATIDEIKKLMKSMEEEKNASSQETSNDGASGTGLGDITETIAEIEDQAVSESHNGGKQRRSRRRRR